jgi:hypothetical protein
MLTSFSETQAEPLSRPTACRSTPLTTTALPFLVRLDPEGAAKKRLTAYWCEVQLAEGNRSGAENRPSQAPLEVAWLSQMGSCSSVEWHHPSASLDGRKE